MLTTVVLLGGKRAASPTFCLRCDKFGSSSEALDQRTGTLETPTGIWLELAKPLSQAIISVWNPPPLVIRAFGAHCPFKAIFDSETTSTEHPLRPESGRSRFG